jgi:hypothetical protein
MYGSYYYYLIQCKGCETVRLKIVESFSEWEENQVSYYPAPVSRRMPDWLYRLPKDHRELVLEVYSAIHAKHYRIAMMGARTLIDMTMIDKVGDVGTFEEKLKEFVLNEYTTNKQKDVLVSALDAGSASAHRGHVPSVDVVKAVMDIVEHVLHNVYIIERLAAQVRKETPPRIRTKKNVQ